jgi:hypothetical protein
VRTLINHSGSWQGYGYYEFWVMKIKIECPDGRVFYAKTNEIEVGTRESNYIPSDIVALLAFVQIYCPDGCSSSQYYNILNTQVPYTPPDWFGFN